MPTPTFQRLSVDQFRQLVQQFTFTRRITAVHMHHTWRPRRVDFRGHDTIVGMWRHHTQVNGWSDIAQHLTIDPEGMLWLGRNWNRAPASANGHNGNSAFGPFMFEMVGDFDTGREPFDGAQRAATLEVIAAVQQRFELATDTLRFHNMMSSKSCPGTSIRYEEVLAEVDAIKQRAAQPAPPASAAARRRGNARAAAPREAIDPVVREAIVALARPVPAIDEPGDAELAHDAHEAHAAEHAEAMGLHSAPSARGGGLSPDQLARLRPHLVNLRAGRFSDDGIATTTPADVDAIFDTHLPRWLQAQDPAQPLNLLFYAHGGLVDEAAGLQIAHKQVDWWIRNGVYPIHFVWETGFFDILMRLLRGLRGARSLDLREHLTDPLLERLAHTAGGVQIWSAMKADAEHASAAPTPSHPLGGGAHYVARRLKAFCDAHPGRLALHAVGHSAGAVFHAHFLTLARQLQVPRFQTAHFFAPAVRVDTFKDTLLPLVGDGAQHAVASLTLFTMRRENERRDHCGHVYGKSLLYLIHHALEDRRDTPILGLEDSLRADAELRAFFGLAGAPAPHGAVVWAPTAASGATSHGGFDDDAATMNSLARRVLGRDPIVAFPATSSRTITPTDEGVEPDDGIDDLAIAALPATAGSRRRALCIGIDAYPEPADRLGGCVNDARNWGAALDTLGFETRLLLDDAASRSGIQAALRALIEGSRAGDVLVLQYAGHGTHVDDLEGDEDDGQDEALCPVDFRDGALFLDDDIARLLARVPEGVNMTLFMDCCHSGTIARFAVGAPARPAGAKARYVRPTAELQQAHRDFRTLHGTARAAAAPAKGRVLRDVKFSACQDHQVALESNGSGEFTLRALRLLRAGIAGVTHTQFQQRLVEAFGPNPPQSPRLDCADGIDGRPLLQPLTGGGAVDGPARAPAAAPLPAPAAAAAHGERTLQAVHLMARAIETLTAP